MDNPIFDATSFVKFNLETGGISSVGKDRLALVPVELLAAIDANDALAEPAQAWGRRHGELLAETIVSRGGSLGVEALAEHLGGTAAVLGMGKVRLEIRGDAIFFRVEIIEEGALSKGRSLLLGGFFKGYVNALTDRQFDVLAVGEERGDQLFWAGNKDAVARIRRKTKSAEEALDAIAKLSSRRD